MPFFKSVTENWRYFRFSPNLDSFVKLAKLKNQIFKEKVLVTEECLFAQKRGKSFRDGSQDIVRIQKVKFGTIFWLLRVKLSRSKLYFHFHAEHAVE